MSGAKAQIFNREKIASMIINPIVSSWVVHTPVVFRFMERQYVDAFFSTGDLRISSMREFRNHKDEKFRDGLEGTCLIVGHQSDGSFFNGVAEGGHKSFILCGSTVMKPEYFGKNAAIQIFDTTAFGIEVGKCIPGLQRGVEGFCIYNNLPIEFQVPVGIT